MRINKKMPSFAAVAAGQTAICDLPIGLTYHQLMIRYVQGAGGTDATEEQFKSDIEEIRLMVDGDAKWRLSGEELIALNKYYGKAFNAGVLPMFFSRPWQRTIAGEDELAFGTGDVQSMNLEIDIASGATNPALDLYALQGPQTKLGRHVCIRRFAQAVSTTGENEISDLPRGQYGLLAAHIGSGDVASLEVEANQRKIFEMDQALCAEYYGQTDRAVQAGYFHVDFAATNRLSDNLPLTLEDFRLKADFTSAGAFNILLERIEARAGVS